MDRKSLATRRFDLAEQLGFAALSGDHNPIHVDALAARRTQAGAPVVHGIHALLWALDELAAAGVIDGELCEIGAQFRKFIYLDVACDLVVAGRDASAAKIELHADGLVVATLQLRNGARKIRADDASFALPDVTIAGTTPNAPALSELTGSFGWTSAPAAAVEFERVFPRLAGVVGPERVAAFASLSRLVGMVCPGLNSMFAALAVDLVHPPSPRSGIGFKITMVNDRYRLIGMDVGGSGIAGTAKAFMRWPPVESPPMAAIAEAVAAKEFAAVMALIVGGSRGLGAVTAKVIAAGGGRAVITYAKGREDADKLAQEINAVRGPGVCVALAYDSAGDAATQLSALTGVINQLYYFATPPISRPMSDLLSPEVFRKFCSVYLDGFHDVCRFVRARSSTRVLSVLYPSSVYVAEQRPAGLTEYAMAKAAGEILCADMMQRIPGLNIFVRRLPRILTDQTATIAHVENADPLAAMLPFIREIQQPA